MSKIVILKKFKSIAKISFNTIILKLVETTVSTFQKAFHDSLYRLWINPFSQITKSGDDQDISIKIYANLLGSVEPKRCALDLFFGPPVTILWMFNA